MHSRIPPRPILIAMFCIGIVICLTSSPASAELGGDLNSVQTDGARMKGTIKVKEAQSYSIHEITDTHGITVREYVTPEGRVFGVAWQGPFFPDMKALMGAYFQQYSDGAQKQKKERMGRRPLNIEEPGLVVQTGGIMRHYFGRAFVPDMIPQEVKAEVIR